MCAASISSQLRLDRVDPAQLVCHKKASALHPTSVSTFFIQLAKKTTGKETFQPSAIALTMYTFSKANVVHSVATEEFVAQIFAETWSNWSNTLMKRSKYRSMSLPSRRV
jgi:hypothetical protein